MARFFWPIFRFRRDFIFFSAIGSCYRSVGMASQHFFQSIRLFGRLCPFPSGGLCWPTGCTQAVFRSLKSKGAALMRNPTSPNKRFEPTAQKLRFWAPSALRAPASAQAAR